MRWLNVALAVVLILAAAGAGAGVGADVVRTVFTVQGMHCDGCSAAITGALERIDGVIEASADHEAGRAEAVYRPKKVSADELKAAIEKLGYTVTAMETVPADPKS